MIAMMTLAATVVHHHNHGKRNKPVFGIPFRARPLKFTAALDEQSWNRDAHSLATTDQMEIHQVEYESEALMISA